MTLLMITEPSVEPVTLEEAKLHCRVDASEDDDLISGLITSARDWVESFDNRALITQTWELILDSFPGSDILKLPLPPLQSVSSIKYINDAGIEATFATTDYTVDWRSEPGRIRLMENESWPSVDLYIWNGVRIRFICGFGLAASVPERYKQAIKLLVGHWYENREQVMAGVTPSEIPFGVKALLWPKRFKESW